MSPTGVVDRRSSSSSVRFVYTPATSLDVIPRPYVRLRVNGTDLLALLDTGADHSVLTQEDARLAQISYVLSEPTLGVGGPVRSFRAAKRATVTLLGPQRTREGIRWVELGTHVFRPVVIASAVPMPSLVGRADLLSHYRLCISEGDDIFDLRVR